VVSISFSIAIARQQGDANLTASDLTVVQNCVGRREHLDSIRERATFDSQKVEECSRSAI